MATVYLGEVLIRRIPFSFYEINGSYLLQFSVGTTTRELHLVRHARAWKISSVEDRDRDSSEAYTPGTDEQIDGATVKALNKLVRRHNEREQRVQARCSTHAKATRIAEAYTNLPDGCLFDIEINDVGYSLRKEGNELYLARKITEYTFIVELEKRDRDWYTARVLVEDSERYAACGWMRDVKLPTCVSDMLNRGLREYAAAHATNAPRQTNTKMHVSEQPEKIKT